MGGMAGAQEVHELGLLEVGEQIRHGALTSAAVTRALLDRIARLDGRLHSFLAVFEDEAMAQARAADAEIAGGRWRGPLHGVPIALKDLVWVKDRPTTAGMAILKDFRPDEDATVAARLHDAGAVILGKLNVTEGASLSHHPAFPRPVNPWNPDYWTGVSSSGSGVAVAAGLCFGALGSDTGGSIRMPSAANGITGVKPTWGRVSRHGIVPLAETFDHVGPMARSVADAAAMLQVIAGADPKDPTTLGAPVPDYLAALEGGVEGLTLGVDWRFATEDVAPEIAAAVRDAVDLLRGLGAQVRDIAFPWDLATAREISLLMLAEIAAAHEPWRVARRMEYGPDLAAFLDLAVSADVVQVAKSYQARERVRGRLAVLFETVDLIIAPGMPGLTPTWAEMEAKKDDWEWMMRTTLRFTSPFNAAGVPTISLPAGLASNGLPIGVQFAARPLGETLLFRAGQAFQSATGHHALRPPL